jgi:hypothetical protein
VNRQTIKEVMSLMGRKGGLASVEARMVKLTPEQRSEIARVAAKASAVVRTEKAAARRKAEGTA